MCSVLYKRPIAWGEDGLRHGNCKDSRGSTKESIWNKERENSPEDGTGMSGVFPLSESADKGFTSAMCET